MRAISDKKGSSLEKRRGRVSPDGRFTLRIKMGEPDMRKPDFNKAYQGAKLTLMSIDSGYPVPIPCDVSSLIEECPTSFIAVLSSADGAS